MFAVKAPKIVINIENDSTPVNQKENDTLDKSEKQP